MNQYLTPELTQWIADSRAAGQTDSQLTQALVAQGWPEAVAAQVIKDSPAPSSSKRRTKLAPVLVSLGILLFGTAGTAAASYQGYLPAVSRLAAPLVVNEDQATKLAEALIAASKSSEIPNRSFKLTVRYTPAASLGDTVTSAAIVDCEDPDANCELESSSLEDDLPQVQVVSDALSVSEQLENVAIETLPLEVTLDTSVYQSLGGEASLKLNLENLAAKLPAWPATLPKQPSIFLKIPDGANQAFLSTNLPLYPTGGPAASTPWYAIDIPKEEFFEEEALTLKSVVDESNSEEIIAIAKKLVPYVSYDGLVRHNGQPAHKMVVSLNRAAIEALSEEGRSIFPETSDALETQITLVMHRDTKVLLAGSLTATYTSATVGTVELSAKQEEITAKTITAPSPTAPIEELTALFGF